MFFFRAVSRLVCGRVPTTRLGIVAAAGARAQAVLAKGVDELQVFGALPWCTLSSKCRRVCDMDDDTWAAVGTMVTAIASMFKGTYETFPLTSFRVHISYPLTALARTFVQQYQLVTATLVQSVITSHRCWPPYVSIVQPTATRACSMIFIRNHEPQTMAGDSRFQEHIHGNTLLEAA